MDFFKKKKVEWEKVHHYVSLGLSGIRYVLFYGREPIGTPEANRSISYHRDWSIKLEEIKRTEFSCRKDGNNFTSEGLLINKEYLKEKRLYRNEHLCPHCGHDITSEEEK